jgi:peptide/nickel transport system substrate-binding protein
MSNTPTNKWSRRKLLKSGASISFGAAASGLILPTMASALTPTTGGRFRYAVVGAAISDSLDPAIYADIAPGIMGWQSRNNLVEVDADNRLVPELAETIDAMEGGKKWVLKLRKGVEFHNGKTFKSEDVLYTLGRHIGEKSTSAVKPFFEAVTDMTAVDDHTVVITLDAPNADFPYYLADYHVQIVPTGTTDFSDGMGTGAYVMDSFEPGIRCTGTRNPNYWKAGHGNFDEVECLAISDSTARVNALMTGEADAIMFVDTKVVDRLDRMNGMQVIEAQSGTHMTLPMNVTAAPYDNNDIRLALKHAINREQLVETILRGHGTVANDHPIASTSPYFNAELEQRQYDPDKAKFHLKKAGVDTLDVTLSSSNTILGYGNDVAVLVKESAAAADIDVTVQQEPADGYWSNVWQKKPWAESYYLTRPTPDSIFSLAYRGGAAWNETFWGNDRFDTLLEQGRAEVDETLRKEIYGEMQAIVSNEGGAVIPFFASVLDAASDKVVTGNVSGLSNLDGGRAAERWWFSA